MEDIRLAVEWTSINAHRFGGDANKIVLSGQSAGAHITLCLLVSDYLEKKMMEQDAKNKSGRDASRSHAERYLTNTDDSGSIYEEDDSDADYSDYESDISEEVLMPEAAETPIPGVPSSHADDETLEQETDRSLATEAVTVEMDTEISPLTVEYMTPLRSSTHTGAKLPKSPRGCLNADGSEKVRHSHSRRSRRAGSLLNAHSESVDDGQVHTPNKHAHVLGSSSHKKRSYSSGNIEPQTRPASGSIIDMIDTYLGANISTNNHKSASSKIISNTASSLKKKFREQVRRNSDAMSYEPDRFFPPGESSSSSEGPGPEEAVCWREVDSVRKSARRNSPRSMALLNRSQGTPTAGVHSSLGSLSRFPRVLEETDPAVSGLESLRCPEVSSPVVTNPISHKKAVVRARKIKKKFSVVSNIKLFIGVSGPYNLEALESHLHQRGMDSRILNWICRGSIGNYSPTTQLAEYAQQLLALQHEERNLAHNGVDVAPQVYSVSQPSAALADLTPIALFHGSRDATIPVSICTDLSNVLHMHGANALCKIYEGWSHTDAILEAPLSGTMRLFHDMAGVIFAHTAECSSTLGSVNNIAGLPVVADRLVIPPNPNAQEPDDYICSPLDYLSLTLFPKLFSSGAATAHGIATERVHVPGSTNTSISGDDTRKHAPLSPSTENSHHSQASHTTERARRKHLERKRKAGKVASSNDPMVSQLLVKMAREINPF